MKYYININKEEIINFDKQGDYVWIWEESEMDYGEYEIEILESTTIIKKDGKFLLVHPESISYK